MMRPVRVTVVGAPVACGAEMKDTRWELSWWISRQLRVRYGDAVELDRRDLFDPGCPPISEGVKLPLVLVNEEVLSSGGKLSVPRIRQAVEDLGVAAAVPESGRKMTGGHTCGAPSPAQRPRATEPVAADERPAHGRSDPATVPPPACEGDHQRASAPGAAVASPSGARDVTGVHRSPALEAERGHVA